MKNLLTKLCYQVVALPLRFNGVKFGTDVRIGPGYDVFGVCQTNIFLGDCVEIGRRAWIQTLSVSAGHITIGPRTSIGRDVVISSAARISIGNDCMLSYRVSIIDHDHSFRLGKGPSKNDVDERTPVSIGDRTFVGANTTILKGVTIGSDCIIGANSVVTTNVPNGTITAGNPAKVLRIRS